MELKVKYHDEKMPRIQKISKGDWIDLRAIVGGHIIRDGEKIKDIWETIEVLNLDTNETNEVTLMRYKKGDQLMICLGVTIAPPDGYELYLAPRSSTFKNYGIIQTNSWGVGDSSFRGNNDVYHMPAYALRDGVIALYDRVAQFRIVESMPALNIIEVEDTGYSDRDGFGSTGVK